MDVSWSWSWRHPPGVEPGNHDALWLFLKIRESRTSKGLSGRELLSALVPMSSRPSADVEAQRDDLLRTLRKHLASFKKSGRPFSMPRERHFRGAGPGRREVVYDEVEVVPNLATGTYDVRSWGPWKHGFVSPQASDHCVPTGAEIVPAADGAGAFLQRSAANPGSGPVTFSGVRVRLRDSDLQWPAQVKVLPIEMVYVPAADFQLGDPAGLDGPASTFFNASEMAADPQTDWTYPVTSEDEIVVVSAYPDQTEPPTLIWDNSGQYGQRGNIPAAYPKGWQAFYAMKHQVLQGEYAAFINALSGDAVTNRFPYGGQGDYRYTVFKTTTSERVATRPARPANWFSWGDAAAWLWWAGLRPMTELEFEKLCRGTEDAVSNEYAWGTTNATGAYVILGDENGGFERVTGNCNISNNMHLFQGGDGGIGPVSADSFGRLPGVAISDGGLGAAPRPPTATRESTGTSFYGAFGLSGNLWELVVSAGNTTGRSFTGVHGNGQLTSTGEPAYTDDAVWPPWDGDGVGFRGGSWFTSASKGQVASRSDATGIAGYYYRAHDTGIRGVRTAPAPASSAEPGSKET